MGFAVLALALLLLDSGGAAQRPVYDSGNGVTSPVLIKDVKPQYTADAMKKKVQGSVFLEGVVDENGRVGDIKVVKPLHPDLDEAAINAFSAWQFRPGTRDGTPVAVRITYQAAFALQHKK